MRRPGQPSQTFDLPVRLAHDGFELGNLGIDPAMNLPGELVELEHDLFQVAPGTGFLLQSGEPLPGGRAVESLRVADPAPGEDHDDRNPGDGKGEHGDLRGADPACAAENRRVCRQEW